MEERNIFNHVLFAFTQAFFYHSWQKKNIWKFVRAWRIACRIAKCFQPWHHELIFLKKNYDSRARKSMPWFGTASLVVSPAPDNFANRRERSQTDYVLHISQNNKKTLERSISTSVQWKIYDLNLRREFYLIKINKWTSCTKMKDRFFFYDHSFTALNFAVKGFLNWKSFSLFSWTVNEVSRSFVDSKWNERKLFVGFFHSRDATEIVKRRELKMLKTFLSLPAISHKSCIFIGITHSQLYISGHVNFYGRERECLLDENIYAAVYE